MCAKCSRLGGKNRALGQGAGRGPPKQGRELSVGQETGLAPVIPALMSWKRAETAQHEKASEGKALLMPAGQEKTEQGGKRPFPSPHPRFSSWRLDLPGEGTWEVKPDQLRLK